MVNLSSSATLGGRSCSIAKGLLGCASACFGEIGGGNSAPRDESIIAAGAFAPPPRTCVSFVVYVPVHSPDALPRFGPPGLRRNRLHLYRRPRRRQAARPPHPFIRRTILRGANILRPCKELAVEERWASHHDPLAIEPDDAAGEFAEHGLHENVVGGVEGHSRARGSFTIGASQTGPPRTCCVDFATTCRWPPSAATATFQNQRRL